MERRVGPAEEATAAQLEQQLQKEETQKSYSFSSSSTNMKEDQAGAATDPANDAQENPWDFIEKEILEFQSVVRELEEYSLKSK